MKKIESYNLFNKVNEDFYSDNSLIIKHVEQSSLPKPNILINDFVIIKEDIFDITINIMGVHAYSDKQKKLISEVIGMKFKVIRKFRPDADADNDNRSDIRWWSLLNISELGYNHKNVWIIDESLIKTQQKPIYKPKGRIKRIGESIRFERPYYRIMTKDEIIDKYGDDWEYDAWWSPNMDYLFGEKIPSLNDDNFEDRILTNFDGEKYIKIKNKNPNSDFEVWFILVDIIIREKPKKPSYIPKGKIKRIGESVKIKYPYRFKTEEEFINDYGHDWRYDDDESPIAARPGWDDDMDILFNQVIPYQEDELNKNDDYMFNGSKYLNWWVTWDMVTKNEEYWTPTKPTYKPKGRIKRVGESVVFNGTDVFCVGKYKILELENILIKNGYTWDSWGNKHILENNFYYILNFEEGMTFHINKEEKSISGTFDKTRKYNILFDYNINKSGLLSFLYIKPSYKPKGKIKRIDESVEINYPYSFKTEENFIKDFGEDWREKVEYGWVSPDMDDLFGQTYPYKKNVLFGINKLPRLIIKLDDNDIYINVSWDMLIENKSYKPTYKPKKITR